MGGLRLLRVPWGRVGSCVCPQSASIYVEKGVLFTASNPNTVLMLLRFEF